MAFRLGALKKDTPAGPATLPGYETQWQQAYSLGSRNPHFDTVGAAPAVPTSSAPSVKEGDPDGVGTEACRPGQKEGSLAQRC